MVPKTSKPMVICHEMAHQIGYASESECNFIGFLAAVHNDDLFIQYSAYANALRYCLALIAMEDQAQFKLLKTKINTGIVLDFKENERFWNSYESIIDKGFHAFYDNYLKINQQNDGIASYSKYIDLMINYYQNKNL
jgi:GH43 family beta-xylosidase